MSRLIFLLFMKCFFKRGIEAGRARTRRSKVAGQRVQHHGLAPSCFDQGFVFFFADKKENLPAIAKVTLALGENSV